MNDRLLITVQDIKTFRPTADLDPERVEPFIREVQRVLLKAVLNPAFYFDFINKVDDEDADEYEAYNKLLNGTDYTYQNKALYFDGLKPMLCYMVLEKFARNPVNITRYGMTKKLNNQSEAATDSELRILIADLRACVDSTTDEVLTFLQNNANTYPLYKNDQSNNLVKGPSLKFFKL